LKTPIRLIAIDLDGTLLRDDKTISPRVLETIAEATRRGIHVVLASARPPRTTRAFHEQLGLSSIQVNYNGALIWDQIAQQVIDHAPLPATVAQQLIDTARSAFADVLVHCEILNRWHTDRVDDRFQTESAKLYPPDAVGPLASFAHLDVTKLMFQGPPAMMDAIAQLLSEESAATCVRTDPDLLQYMRAGIDKGTGLRRVCELTGVPMHAAMAIGDNENDIAMLRAAGMGVAMGHARDEVKRAAAHVVGTNEADGVAEAIERFALA
jgi:hypothetical protein